MGLCQSKGMFQKNRAIEFPPNSIDSSTQRNAVYKSHGTEVTAGEETPLNISKRVIYYVLNLTVNSQKLKISNPS